MKKIENEKVNMNEIEDKKKLDKLIDYGMINRLLTNEVVGYRQIQQIQEGTVKK
jgi:hypothetical protein